MDKLRKKNKYNKHLLLKIIKLIGYDEVNYWVNERIEMFTEKEKEEIKILLKELLTQ